MKGVQLFVALIAILIGTNAFGVCSKRDVFGWWTLTVQGSGVKELCNVRFRSNGALHLADSACTAYRADGSGSTRYGFTGGSITVNANCGVSGVLTSNNFGAANIGGLLARDGQSIIGVLVNSGGLPSTFQGLKWK